MTAALTAGAGDVVWSLGFLARHAPVILALAAVPAAQRVVAALHPDDLRMYAWPVELLVAALRLGTVAAVVWLGWREDARVRRTGLDTAGEATAAVGDYVREDWPRVVVAIAVAALVLLALATLAGPGVQAVAAAVGTDARVADAWTFALRNLVVIPVFYVVVYGLVRPAFLGP